MRCGAAGKSGNFYEKVSNMILSFFRDKIFELYSGVSFSKFMIHKLCFRLLIQLQN